jgi:hypothetical protein
MLFPVQTFLFQQNLYQDANALLGVAARLAQKMGFHRDPSHFPYSPWVCGFEEGFGIDYAASTEWH